jgi:hypothetical protein
LPDDIDPIGELRRLALLIRYVTDRIRLTKDSERGATTKQLYKLLRPFDFKFSDQKFDRLSRADLATLQQGQREAILRKIQRLISQPDYDVPHPTAVQLEEYTDELAYAFRKPLPFSLIQGNLLGDNGAILSGVWRLFFRPTIGDPNRDPKSSTELRGFVAIVRKPKDFGAISAETVIISQHKHWIGHVFLNGTYAYWVCTDPDKTETAFFLSTKPDDNASPIVGVGTSLQSKRPRSHSPRPIESFCYFGAKWTNYPVIPGGDTMLGAIINASPTMNDAIENTRASTLCNEVYKRVDQLQHNYPTLHEYLSRIRVNREHDFNSPGIHIEWT